MKKILLLVVSCGVFFVVTGCSHVEPEVSKPIGKTTVPAEMLDKEPVVCSCETDPECCSGPQEEVGIHALYEQWSMKSDMGYYDVNDYERDDCMGMWNGNNHDGDLLSSLIADGDFRSLRSLDRYTPAYVMGLENRVAGYTKAEHDADFYAFYTCNFGDGIDLVAGYYNPAGTVYQFEWEGLTDSNRKLLLVNGNDVHEFPNVRTLDNTLTGGEVSPCTAEETRSAISWSCMIGPTIGDDGDVSWEGMRKREYILGFDGEILKNEEVIEYFE